MPQVVQVYPPDDPMESTLVVVVKVVEENWLKIWMDVMQSETSNELSGRNRGCWM